MFFLSLSPKAVHIARLLVYSRYSCRTLRRPPQGNMHAAGLYIHTYIHTVCTPPPHPRLTPASPHSLMRTSKKCQTCGRVYVPSRDRARQASPHSLMRTSKKCQKCGRVYVPSRDRQASTRLFNPGMIANAKKKEEEQEGNSFCASCAAKVEEMAVPGRPQHHSRVRLSPSLSSHNDDDDFEDGACVCPSLTPASPHPRLTPASPHLLQEWTPMEVGDGSSGE